MTSVLKTGLRSSRITILALAIGCASTASSAEIASSQYRNLNLNLRDHHTLPAYRVFAKTAALLKQDVEKLCAKSTESNLTGARKGFHGALDAWTGIQHIQFGPVEMFMRHFRMQFWPTRRNLGPKQIRALLAAGDPDALSEKSFPSTSVAVQGFPAMEWLLFSKNSGALLLTDTPQTAYRCAILAAISTNIKNVSDNIQAEWRGAGGYSQLMESAQKGNDRFSSNAEATLEAFKGFYGGLHDIADIKLGRVLGPDIEHARGVKAVFQLSNRSFRDIRLGLKSLKKMYDGEGGYADFVQANAADKKLNADIQAEFTNATHALDIMTLPLQVAVSNPQERAKVVALAKAVKRLSQLATIRLSKALDVGVGFNSRDGD